MHGTLTPSALTSPAVAALFVDAYERSAPRVSLPCAEIELVVRFGPMARGGVDVHALGGRPRVRRKHIHGGQRAVTARLRLGTHAAVLGAPASELAGHVVPLEALWGAAAARRLTDRLTHARHLDDAAAVVDAAIAERLAAHRTAAPHASLVRAAAERLHVSNVTEVADALGVSERHLRRVFRDLVGVGPKAFARLARFQRAVRAAQLGSHGWADIALGCGYYDQAHLISEFRRLSGATPRAFVDELLAVERQTNGSELSAQGLR